VTDRDGENRRGPEPPKPPNPPKPSQTAVPADGDAAASAADQAAANQERMLETGEENAV
jgi:hypothetical protein